MSNVKDAPISDSSKIFYGQNFSRNINSNSKSNKTKKICYLLNVHFCRNNGKL